MATLEQANTYHAVRQNEDWLELDPGLATALLSDAEDYIRTTYSLRVIQTPDEQRIFDGIVCRLADLFRTSPPAVAGKAALKKESKEIMGLKKSVEYADAPSDPYPYVTAMLSLFIVKPAGVTMGRMVRR